MDSGKSIIIETTKGNQSVTACQMVGMPPIFLYFT